MFTKWQNLFIPFTGGLDTKTDDKAVQPTDLVKLENGVYVDHGAISKRFGYDRIQDYLITKPEICATFKDELLISDIDTLYSQRNDSWDNKGSFENVAVTSQTVLQEPHDQARGDMAETDFLRVYTWGDSRGLSYSVQDIATGAWLVNSALATATGTLPRVVALANQVTILWADSGATNIDYLTINDNSPTSFTTGTLISDMHAASVFDVTVGTSYYFVGYRSTATNDIRLARVQGVIVDSTFDTGEASVGPTLINVCVDAENAMLFYRQSATAIRAGAFTGAEDVFAFSQVGNVVTGLTAVLELTATIVPNTDSGTEDVICFYNDDGGIYTTQIRTDLTEAESGLCTLQANISSQAFTVDSKAFIVLQHESNLAVQNSYYLIRQLQYDGAGSTVARGRFVSQFGLKDAEQAPAAAEQHHASVLVSGTTAKVILSTKKRLVLTTDSTADLDEVAFTERSLTVYDFDFNYFAYNAVEVEDGLYFSGGLTWLYDGVTIAEAQPLMFPELALEIGATAHAAVSTNNTGGFIAAGTYGYKVVYERRTHFNERVQSFGIPFSVTIGGTTTGIITLTIPTLTQTNRTDWYIVIYRTVDGGGSFHRVTSPDPAVNTGNNRWVDNSLTATSVQFIDELVDADITSFDLDPAQNGILSNISIPAGSFLAQAKRRVFSSGGLIPENRVYFSKLLQEGNSVEFNDQLFFEVNETGGPITVLAPLNDQLIIFKESKIFTINGDGPNNQGLGQFQEPIVISTDSGCTNSKAVVEMPFGVMYKSAKGIYLIDRAGKTNYIGADVERYNNLTCIGAELLPDENAVLFIHSDGPALYYDYNFQKWSTFTNHQGIATTIWQGKFSYLTPDGDLLTQNGDKFRDGNQTYALSFRTGPIRIEGLQGFWRCRYAYFLGEYFTPHQMRVDVYYDRESYARNQETYQPTDFIDTSTWGDEPTWGDDDVWGGSTGQDYQMSMRMHPQKCQSVAFEFTELPDTVENGKAFQLTELALEWGPMSGLGRLDTTRRK